MAFPSDPWGISRDTIIIALIFAIAVTVAIVEITITMNGGTSTNPNPYLIYGNSTRGLVLFSDQRLTQRLDNITLHVTQGGYATETYYVYNPTNATVEMAYNVVYNPKDTPSVVQVLTNFDNGLTVASHSIEPLVISTQTYLHTGDKINAWVTVSLAS